MANSREYKGRMLLQGNYGNSYYWCIHVCVTLWVIIWQPDFQVEYQIKMLS